MHMILIEAGSLALTFVLTIVVIAITAIGCR
jgi:hypothetical protein